jgi:diadenosine tetraphosphate (Ap4A) HIT family hydrolase
MVREEDPACRRRPEPRCITVSKWNSRDEWRGLCDGSACPVCARGYALDTVATLEASWLTMFEGAPMVGYVCLVSRVHAVELHDLSAEQAASFMRDAQRVSAALATVTGAVKLNYEIHGNTLPHLHLHFFPRYVGDPFEGRAIEPGRIRHAVYAEGEFEAVKSRLLQALDAGVA